MATRRQREAAFHRQVKAQVQKARAITDQDTRFIIREMRAFDQSLTSKLAQQEIDVTNLQALRTTSRQEVEFLTARLQAKLVGSELDAARAGVAMVKEPLGEVLSPTRMLQLGDVGVSSAVVSAATQFSADLIGISSGGLGARMLGRINAELAFAAQGAISSSTAITNISRQLGTAGGFTYQAERIFRTEVLRIHSMATQAQLENAERVVPEMRKSWVWSGVSREAHAEAEAEYGPGKGIPVGQPFIVDGEPLMGPRMGGSPENTINCGCAEVPDVPDVALDLAA